jgi:outer membrane protein assembly factor BamB
MKVPPGDGDTLGMDGTLYGSWFNVLHAIDTRNGTVKWKAGAISGTPVRSTPAIGADGTIYVAKLANPGCCALRAVRLDGTEKWALNTPNIPELGGFLSTSSPAIGRDGTIYFAVGAHLHAIR